MEKTKRDWLKSFGMRCQGTGLEFLNSWLAVLYANHALSQDSTQAIVVRSPSGDVDINILFVSMFEENSDKIHIDYGTGKNRKILSVGSFDMIRKMKTALIGFHAFTGNDYVPSFFKKSNKHHWRLLEKKTDLLKCFNRLKPGADWLQH